MPTRLPHRRAFKSPLLNVLVGVMTASVLFITWAVVLVGASEAYCGFMPDVDTRFASGFTEAGFNRIGAGMDSAQVAAVLGEPYSTYGDENDRVWAYSGDGGAWWLGLDFAWLGREISFDKRGKVRRCVRTVYYD